MATTTQKCSNCSDPIKGAGWAADHLPDDYVFCEPCRDAEISHGFDNVRDADETFEEFRASALEGWIEA